ncbi:hypothetical protein SKAU_G00260310 [Synaphobranchus kaupii]|uniref:Uncharacterized protein n=1 Tax=Synaphobranchus kaupii TaxID=118154 RepID=A0A9Q1IRU9_SYNKA|nr:hypothetical protein SKAU_G00260310 [Synaphobranchus kaupii]
MAMMSTAPQIPVKIITPPCRTDGGQGKAESASRRLESCANLLADYDDSSKSPQGPRGSKRRGRAPAKPPSQQNRGSWAVKCETQAAKEGGSKRGSAGDPQAQARSRPKGQKRTPQRLKTAPGEGRQSSRDKPHIEEEEREGGRTTPSSPLIPSNRISAD